MRYDSKSTVNLQEANISKRLIQYLPLALKSIVPTSISGRALKALKSVIVLPLPGGPQSTMGLCSASQVYRRASCRTVSTVGTTISGAATLCVSTSIWGTFDCHSAHSPWIVTWKEKGQNIDKHLNSYHRLSAFECRKRMRKRKTFHVTIPTGNEFWNFSERHNTTAVAKVRPKA